MSEAAEKKTFTKSNSAEPMVFSLFDVFYTYSDVNKALGFLRNFLETNLFSGQKVTPEEFSDANKLDQSYQDWLVKSLTNSEIKNLSSKDYLTFISALKVQIDSTPRLGIYFPFVFPEKNLAELAKKSAETVGQRVLLDIKFDPDLVGGCAFVWKGNYGDFSMRSLIKQNNEKVRSMLGEFSK